MPDCRLSFEIVGESLSSEGLPQILAIQGRVAPPHTQVTVRASALPGAVAPLVAGNVPVLYAGGGDPALLDPADPNNDGTWRLERNVGALALPCGIGLWVRASAGPCEELAFRPIVCKGVHPEPPGSPPGGPGGPPTGPTGWPWLDPPHIQCPRLGRRFAEQLALGLFSLALGVTVPGAPTAVAAVLVLGLAANTWWLWRTWCVPNACVLRGAALWAFKIGFATSLLPVLLAGSIPGAALLFVYGVVAGWLVAELRHRRCFVPSTLDPLSSLGL